MKETNAFIEMVVKINKKVNSFNSYLNPAYKVPILETDFNNTSFYTDLVNIKWKDQHWPNAEDAGVYFIFGKNCITVEPGVYIGKASFDSAIGYRVWTWLAKDKEEGNYTMNDKDGKMYKLEYITTISTTTLKAPFLAPSLEEYLRTNLKNEILLLNSTGNK